MVTLESLATTLEQLRDDFTKQFKAIETRLDRLEVKVDAVDEKVDAVDEKVDAVDEKVDAVDEKVGWLQNHALRQVKAQYRTAAELLGVKD